MHELAVTQSILETVLEHARANGAARVVRVRLVKGELNDYVDDTLRWLFETMAGETVAAGAAIEVRHAPIRFRCGACSMEFAVERDQLAAQCPDCQSTGVELIGGREFLLESIEIE